jgi:hypothetical protein
VSFTNTFTELATELLETVTEVQHASSKYLQLLFMVVVLLDGLDPGLLPAVLILQPVSKQQKEQHQ